MHDPDSPDGTFIHWAVWNIDPTITNIVEDTAPVGSSVGVNDFGQQAYGGPCPQNGTHHYIFELYALDTMLNLPETTTGVDVTINMQSHILTKARTMGTFGE